MKFPLPAPEGAQTGPDGPPSGGGRRPERPDATHDVVLPDDAVIDRALKEVDVGRRLVIYERTTGLFAHWYLALRCDEECYRARRYDRPLSLAVVEPAAGADSWHVSQRITSALQEGLRKADLAAYLGNARYVLLMPETGPASARGLAGRLRRKVPEAQAGISTFPRDGLAFDDLYAVAARRLGSDAETHVVEDLQAFRRVRRSA